MSASLELDASLRPLKKRQRLVLNKWSKLISCDTCRSRKVRCIRLDEDSPVCKACKSRDQACQTTSSSEPNDQQKTYTPAGSEVSSQELVQISHHSTEAGLQQGEMSESFMADLLASFFQHSDEQTPYADFSRVRAEFEQAGRRLDQLSPLTEPLVLAMMATSAHYTDSQLLLGADAPRLKDLRSVHNSTDLLQFGYRRQELCEQLLCRVVKLTDSRGLFRKASLQSISVLMMILRMLRHPLPVRWKELADMGDTWRPFMSASVDHVRTLLHKYGIHNVNLGHRLWPMALADAIKAAFSGCNPQITDEDLEDFPHMSGIPPPHPETMGACMMSDDARTFVIPIITGVNYIVQHARKLAKTLSIPVTKNRPINLHTFLERIKDARACLNTMRDCQKVATKTRPLIPPTTLHTQKITLGAYVTAFIESGIQTPALLVPAIHKFYEIYKKQHSCIVSQVDTEEELLRNQIKQQLQVGLVESIFTVTEAIRRFEGKEMVASLTRPTSLIVFIQDTIVYFIHMAFDIPTKEEDGYSALWTHKVKAETLRFLIDATRLQVWAWCDREKDVAICEYRYQQYLSRTQRSIAAHTNASSGQTAPSMTYSTSTLSTSTSHSSINHQPFTNPLKYQTFSLGPSQSAPSEVNSPKSIEPLLATEYSDLWAGADSSAPSMGISERPYQHFPPV